MTDDLESLAERFAADVSVGLERQSNPDTKQWWERYMKGEARFRGVKMADTRRVVTDLVARHNLNDADAEDYLATALRCISQPWTEDKLAGVLLLAEHGLPTLRIGHLRDLAEPLATGMITDWNVCDWYCVKVLGPFITNQADVEARARAVGAWVTTESLWQRRAGAVSFVYHASTEPELFPGFTDLIIGICETNMTDPTRWSQTSVGWLLRELAHRRPELVAEFVAEHPELSLEARRNALKHIG